MCLLVGPVLVAAQMRRHTRPQIPLVDRTADERVFLDHADFLTKHPEDSFMILVGNVVFTKGGMIMSCDSAHYVPETESMDAFGNVRMTQGDTLEVNADELNFDGLTEIAVLYGSADQPVRMRNRDVHLTTDVFNYDLRSELAYYDVGGTLWDSQNRLTSVQGEYAPPLKEANFYINVHLNSRDSKDTLDIYSDTLYYNTLTHIAELHSPSTVINARGTIYTDCGVYDTDTNATVLYNRSTVVTRQGQTLVADTIHYDYAGGYGQAFGNIVATDSAHNVAVYGQYGYYDMNADSSFVTGRARLAEYSKGDTLWLHGRYIQSFRKIDSIHVAADTVTRTPEYWRTDTSHVAVVFPRVRFYRSDLQGVADSIRFTQTDSTLRMFVNPVIWNEQQQISGKTIELTLNDSTIERAYIPEAAFCASWLGGEHYNQLGGKTMTAFFQAGELRRLLVEGNVEVIMYPEENDSTVNKLVTAESSFMEAWFKGQTTERIKMWPSTNGVATPLFLARPSMYYLAKFKWFEPLRPRDAADIFRVPAEMEQLIDRPAAVVEWSPLPLPERLRLDVFDIETAASSPPEATPPADD